MDEAQFSDNEEPEISKVEAATHAIPMYQQSLDIFPE